MYQGEMCLETLIEQVDEILINLRRSQLALVYETSGRKGTDVKVVFQSDCVSGLLSQ